MAMVAQQYCSRPRPRRREVGNQPTLKQKKEIKACEACKFEHHPLTFNQCRIIDDYGNNYPQLVKACELASLPPPPPLPVKPPPISRNDKKYNQPCSRCQLYESFSAILNYRRLFRDGDDPNLLLLPPKQPPFKSFLLLIHSKRRSSREEGFSSLVDALVYEPRHHFVDGNFLTIVTDYCLPRLTSKKKGSSNFSKKEIRLAVRLISLVAINLVNLDYSHEVYELCVPILSAALFSFNYPWDTVVEILDCLAIVGFLGSNYPGEKEKVMRVIWEFLIKTDDDQSNPRPQSVTASAITAWSCLLSTIKFNTWNLSKCYWTGCVSYFSQLLEKNRKEEDGESVVAAAAALALISQFNFLNRFSNSDDLSHNIQLKFVKRFLGDEGFANHMEQNQNFKGLVRATNEESTLEYGEPEREEAMVKFYPSKVARQTDNSDPDLRFVSGRDKKIQKRMIKSPSSLLNKARTKLLNKQRQFRRNNVIHYENQSDD